MADNSSDHHFALTVNIAIEALRALLIVNGGGATALIALTSKAHGAPDYSSAVLSFGLAALLNAFTLVVGYFSQLAYANHRLAIEQRDTGEADKQTKVHRWCQRIAISLIGLSLISSTAGMICAFRAL